MNEQVPGEYKHVSINNNNNHNNKNDLLGWRSQV